jgi:hypothetical protein
MNDPDFRVERSLALGEENVRCDVTSAKHRLEVRMHREVTRELPKILAKFLSPTQIMLVDELWEFDGMVWTGAMSVQVSGQPIVIESSQLIRASESGSEIIVTNGCQARVPLVGRQIEKFIVGHADYGVEQELAYLAEVLQR